ncbi:MAG: CARDB domain-containing protein [bacterium]|nr:CARDB domain-containing protein [bacterium]
MNILFKNKPVVFLVSLFLLGVATLTIFAASLAYAGSCPQNNTSCGHWEDPAPYEDTWWCVVGYDEDTLEPMYDWCTDTIDDPPYWVSNPACSDLQDNDGDGVTDTNDAQCHTDGNATNGASYVASKDTETAVATGTCTCAKYQYSEPPAELCTSFQYDVILSNTTEAYCDNLFWYPCSDTSGLDGDPGHGWGYEGCTWEQTCTANVGKPCSSATNSCGQSSTGTIQCNNTCTVTTAPSDASCPAPSGSCSLTGASSITVGGSTTWTGSITDCPSGSCSYSWSDNSGAGHSGSAATFSPTFDNSGTWAASLIVNDVITGKSSAAISCASVMVSPAPIDGACSATTINSCDSGTFQDTADDASYNRWNCNGINSGNPASCSIAKINGACGTADSKAYPYGSAGYGTDTQCSSGDSSNTAFPTAGNSTTWTCSGTSGGLASGTCSASQNAAPSSAPIVTTTSANSITTTSANLRGTGNPNGISSTGWFRYSPTSPGSCDDTFGTRSPASGGDNLGLGTSAVAFAQSTTGLTPNTLYYYCAIASNSAADTGFGAVVPFTTTYIDLKPVADPNDVVTPTSATVDVSTPFSMQVQNVGTRTTGSTFSVVLKKANDDQGAGVTFVSATTTNSALTPGASTSGLYISYTPSAGDAGTKYFQICADQNLAGTGTISEGAAYEGNNCGVWTPIVVTSSNVAPNLTAGYPTSVTTQTAVAGVSSTYTVTIYNEGNATTGGSFSNLVQRADSVSGGPYGIATGVQDIIPSNFQAGPLEANTDTGTSKTFAYTFPTGDAGNTRYLRVCADKTSAAGGGIIPESDEDNNCGGWLPYSITAPAGQADLSISAGVTTVTPANPTADQEVTLGATIYNGGAATPGAPFTNIFQIDDDADHSTITTFVTDPIQSPATLAANGGTDPTSAVYTFPSPSTYYIRACADRTTLTGGGVITESDETNNCSSVAWAWTTVTVTDAPPPPTASLDAADPTINVDDSTMLTWSSFGADSCTGGGFSTGAGSPTSGSVSTGPLSSVGPYNYTISCPGVTPPPGTDGVTVNVVNPTSTVTANPPIINPGNTTRIDGRCTDSTGCRLYNPAGTLVKTGTVDPSDVCTLSYTPNPPLTVQTTYTFKCDPISGPIPDATVTVKMKPKFDVF